MDGGQRVDAPGAGLAWRTRWKSAPGDSGPYLPLGIAALFLALATQLLYGQSGVLAALALAAACTAFLLFAAQRVGVPRAALALLAVTAAVNRYTVNLGGLNLKAEHVAVALGAAVVLYRLLRHQARLRLGLAEGLLAGWLALNALAGALNAPQPSGSLKLALMLALVAGAYFVAIHLVGDRPTLIFATFALLAAGTAVAFYGLCAHLLYPFGLDLGIQINPITKVPSPFATIWEGNLFGSYCATIAIFWLALRLSAPAARVRRAAEGGLLIAALGLEVSLARGAWLATLVGLAFVAVATLLLRRRDRGGIAVGARRWAAYLPLLVVASVLLWLNPLVYGVEYGGRLARAARTTAAALEERLAPAQTATSSDDGTASAPASTAPGGRVAAEPAPPALATGTDVVLRAQSTANLGDPTYSQRRETIGRALRDWRAHPFLGWGPGSFGQKYITTSFTPAWVGILSLRALHDTGLLGALLFHAFLLVIGGRALLALWRTADRELRALLFGYLAGCAVLGAAYEVTEGLQLGFVWFFIGLLAAATQLAVAEERAMRA